MRVPANAATRDKILFHLKTKGPQSAARLADRLGITGAGARQHLQRLEADALVAYTDERQRVGRPLRMWRIAERARERFPDNHADLTVEILRAVQETFGERGMCRLIEARTREQRERYAARLPSRSAPLGERVAVLASIRNQEGYMAESRSHRDGSLTLVENHCPICAAAQACTGICSEELGLFQAVLGKGVSVERIEHVLDGGLRCAYRIAPRRR